MDPGGWIALGVLAVCAALHPTGLLWEWWRRHRK